MSNELITFGSLFNRADNVNDDLLADLGGGEWNPSLSIGYATVGAVKQGLCPIGDFILAGKQALGKTIKIVAIDRRKHCALRNQTTKKYMAHSYSFVTNDPDFEAFLAEAPAGTDLLKGADLFCYLPDSRVFVEFWMKSTLARTADRLWKASEGGRVVTLTTRYAEDAETSRSWYELDIGLTNESLEGSPLDGEKIKFDLAQGERALSIFHSVKSTRMASGPVRER